MPAAAGHPSWFKAPWYRSRRKLASDHDRSPAWPERPLRHSHGLNGVVDRPPQAATHQISAVLPEDQKLSLKPEIYAARGEYCGD